MVNVTIYTIHTDPSWAPSNCRSELRQSPEAPPAKDFASSLKGLPSRCIPESKRRPGGPNDPGVQSMVVESCTSADLHRPILIYFAVTLEVSMTGWWFEPL